MKEKLLYFGLNNENNKLCCGFEDSFKIYSLENFEVIIKKEFKGGIGLVEINSKKNMSKSKIK
jgi:hypothetical protein